MFTKFISQRPHLSFIEIQACLTGVSLAAGEPQPSAYITALPDATARTSQKTSSIQSAHLRIGARMLESGTGRLNLV